ncbi:preprotein translocase subunit SecG [Rhodobacteraceae bacterium CCMM004]|nr:preprotein translocase subunit SecG [Rhodobacteraceae bacterium CCMM004]
MENILLIVHLILALCLIGVVLLQRSEGGGLGMGGGGGAISSRGAATALGKMTWLFGIAFCITSLVLTVFAAQNAAGTSVLDRLGGGAAVEEEAPDDLLPPGSDLLPPALGDGPLTPPPVE